MISLIRQDSNRFADGFSIVVYKWRGAIIHCFTLEVGGELRALITRFGVESTPR